jgi:hypothetical protein
MIVPNGTQPAGWNRKRSGARLGRHMPHTAFLRLALTATTLGSLLASNNAGAGHQSFVANDPPWAAECPGPLAMELRTQWGTVPPLDFAALTQAAAPDGHVDQPPALPFGGRTVVLEGVPGSDGAPLSALMPPGWVDAPASPYGDRACVDCINTDRIEGEPNCADGYVDAFNGGCNYSPNVFGSIECGQTVCGKYGTFLSPGGSNYRDTDWYAFTLRTTATVTWTVTGTARSRAFILNGATGCPAASVATAVADPCLPAVITVANLAPGTYYAFAGTDAFSGVACGSTYRATLEVSSCCASPQPGDVPESESVCVNGYVDATNGGCNFSPNVFGAVRCGQTIAGTYGTYLTSGGSNYRDTDWFAFTVPRGGQCHLDRRWRGPDTRVHPWERHTHMPGRVARHRGR